MLRLAISTLAFSASTLIHATDLTQQMRDLQSGPNSMIPSGGPAPQPMRVYLKNGPTQPPLDSFRLIQGEPEIWRWENEDAFFKKGKKITHRIADLDSLVLADSSVGLPAPNGKEVLFLQEAGALNYYALWPKAEGMPPYFQKDKGDLLKTSTQNIRDAVADDPEALNLIDRYSKRWYWRGGIMAGGVGLIAASIALSSATQETDANGEKKATTPVPAILAGAGLLAVIVPITPFINFIWNPLPKRSLDTYNRNRAESK
jgi:hypothetical protein